MSAGRQAKKEHSVGEGISVNDSRWSFSGTAAKHFETHARKSIPYYREGHDVVCRLSDFFVHDNSVVYELGTSLGTLLQKLAKRHPAKSGIKWIGVDCEVDMIAHAQKSSQEMKGSLEFVLDDITSMSMLKSDFVVAYYTIQFVPPRLRQELLNKIYSSLNWGGALIVFEKVRAPDARFQDYMTQIYNEYKLDQGYSAEEIMNKSSSLKAVLEPFSTQGNLDLFQRAGFKDVMSVQKWINFEGFLCIK